MCAGGPGQWADRSEQRGLVLVQCPGHELYAGQPRRTVIFVFPAITINNNTGAFTSAVAASLQATNPANNDTLIVTVNAASMTMNGGGNWAERANNPATGPGYWTVAITAPEPSTLVLGGITRCRVRHRVGPGAASGGGRSGHREGEADRHDTGKPVSNFARLAAKKRPNDRPFLGLSILNFEPSVLPSRRSRMLATSADNPVKISSPAFC